MPMLEQLLRFFDFGEILPRIEIDEDWREHLGYGRRSAISDVKARKSKCAAQLESLRLLASGDFQGFIEGIFGGGNVRGVTDATRTHHGHDTVRHPANAGRFVPPSTINSLKISSPVSSCPASAFATATCIPQNGSQR